MIKQLVLSLTLMMMLMSNCTTTAQNDQLAFPPDVVAEIQTNMDDLTAGERPPGMVVWIDAPTYRLEVESGFANLMDENIVAADKRCAQAEADKSQSHGNGIGQKIHEFIFESVPG